VGAKLDKVASTAQFDRVYVVNSAGEQEMFGVNQAEATPDAIPRYGSGAELKVGDPYYDEDATNKKYVVALIALAISSLTLDSILGEGDTAEDKHIVLGRSEDDRRFTSTLGTEKVVFASETEDPADNRFRVVVGLDGGSPIVKVTDSYGEEDFSLTTEITYDRVETYSREASDSWSNQFNRDGFRMWKEFSSDEGFGTVEVFISREDPQILVSKTEAGPGFNLGFNFEVNRYRLAWSRWESQHNFETNSQEGSYESISLSDEGLLLEREKSIQGTNTRSSFGFRAPYDEDAGAFLPVVEGDYGWREAWKKWVSVPYSTVEQATGVAWLDGKMIYQKTVVCSLDGLATYATEFPHGITTAETFTKVEGVLIGSTPGDTRPANWTELASGTGQPDPGGNLNYRVVGENIVVTVARLDLWVGYKVYVTLQYTKA
jgi:hypothetical protein